jgi:hypothetical protein
LNDPKMGDISRRDAETQSFSDFSQRLCASAGKPPD